MISVVEGVKCFHQRVREKLSRFVKELDQAALGSKLEAERMVDESKMVVKLIHGLRKLSPFRAATTDSGASVEGLTLIEAASLLILMVLIGLLLQVL